MKLNTQKTPTPIRTHEGARAVRITPSQELRRTVMSCLLWEDTFYESGESVAERISSLCDQVSVEEIASLAVEARHQHNLRHAPLLLLCNLVRRGGGAVAANTIERVIARADEMSELLSIYWKDGRKPIANSLRRGLAKVFPKFSEYELAKYAGYRNAISLRDVMFLCHPRPADDDQARAWMQLAAGTLSPPDTWEVSLSAGADKKATFERLIQEKKLGYLALLRNLRNMVAAGVDENIIRQAILDKRGAEKVLPFRFVAAARAVPSLESALDAAMASSIDSLPRLSGKTILLVDVSGSMHSRLSSRSDMTRMDAAAALASVINAESAQVFSFADEVVEVPPRRGMAGVDAIVASQRNGGTYLGSAVERANSIPHDRIIVITDEQSHDDVPQPVAEKAYLINVANYSRGVGYRGAWTHIDGFSESVLRYIHEIERA